MEKKVVKVWEGRSNWIPKSLLIILKCISKPRTRQKGPIWPSFKGKSIRITSIWETVSYPLEELKQGSSGMHRYPKFVKIHVLTLICLLGVCPWGPLVCQLLTSCHYKTLIDCQSLAAVLQEQIVRVRPLVTTLPAKPEGLVIRVVALWTGHCRREQLLSSWQILWDDEIEQLETCYSARPHSSRSGYVDVARLSRSPRTPGQNLPEQRPLAQATNTDEERVPGQL